MLWPSSSVHSGCGRFCGFCDLVTIEQRISGFAHALAHNFDGAYGRIGGQAHCGGGDADRSACDGNDRAACQRAGSDQRQSGAPSAGK